MTTSIVLSATAPIRVLREAIYEALDVCPYVNKANQIRKRCGYAKGLDLRRKADTVLLAQHLGLVAQPAVPVLDDTWATASSLKGQHPQTLGYYSVEVSDWAYQATLANRFELGRALTQEMQMIHCSMVVQAAFEHTFYPSGKATTPPIGGFMC